MLVGPAQPPLVRLAVDGHEVLGQVGEQADRGSAATDVGPGPAVGLDRADEDEAALRDVSAGLLGSAERRVSGGELDHPLDHAAVGACAHQAGVAAATEQQAQAGDDHGLARAGLTGEDGQPGMERQHGLVDDPEVTDADLLDHEPGPSAPACWRRAPPRQPWTGRSNLVTRRSVK